MGLLDQAEAMLAIDAYKTIKKYCAKQYPDCSECCFARWSDDGTNDYCEFDNNPCPVDWSEVEK